MIECKERQLRVRDFNSLTGKFIMTYGAIDFNDETKAPSKISYYMVLSTNECKCKV